MNLDNLLTAIGEVFEDKKTFSQSDFDRFAELSGDNNPIHVDPDFASRTKFGRTVAHGMLLYSMICSFLTKLFPETYQISQELMFPSPTFAGEEITFLLQIVDWQVETGVIYLITNIANQDGELCCQGRATIVPLSNRLEKDNKTAKHMEPRPIVDQCFKGLQIGQSESVRRIFTTTDLDAYTKLTGDNNPLYTDPEFANIKGLRNIIVPPGLLGGMISYLLGTKLPGRGTNWLKQELLFSAPGYVDEEILANVEVNRIRSAKELVNLSTTCRNMIGDLFVSGEALVLVKDLQPI